MIKEITLKEYRELIKPQIVFNTGEFNYLNAEKVKEVHYLIFFDENKKRFAICCGEDEFGVKVPFSAPFASFVPLKARWTIAQLEHAVKDFIMWGRQKRLHSIHFVLPPDFYDRKLINSLINIFLRHNFKVVYQDVNYAFQLMDGTMDKIGSGLYPNARKNLQIALKMGLELKHCIEMEEKHRAYEIIKANREYKGYPLRMSWEQVKSTIEFVEHDFFIVKHENQEIAAAQIFRVSPNIYQVIYWGDMPGYSEYKPINLLADKLIDYYKEKGGLYLDVGPSSEHGEPNYGLCDFKSGIGCEVSSKITFAYYYGEERQDNA